MTFALHIITFAFGRIDICVKHVMTFASGRIVFCLKYAQGGGEP